MSRAIMMTTVIFVDHWLTSTTALWLSHASLGWAQQGPSVWHTWDCLIRQLKSSDPAWEGSIAYPIAEFNWWWELAETLTLSWVCFTTVNYLADQDTRVRAHINCPPGCVLGASPSQPYRPTSASGVPSGSLKALSRLLSGFHKPGEIQELLLVSSCHCFCLRIRAQSRRNLPRHWPEKRAGSPWQLKKEPAAMKKKGTGSLAAFWVCQAWRLTLEGFACSFLPSSSVYGWLNLMLRERTGRSCMFFYTAMTFYKLPYLTFTPT